MPGRSTRWPYRRWCCRPHRRGKVPGPKSTGGGAGAFGALCQVSLGRKRPLYLACQRAAVFSREEVPFLTSPWGPFLTALSSYRDLTRPSKAPHSTRHHTTPTLSGRFRTDDHTFRTLRTNPKLSGTFDICSLYLSLSIEPLQTDGSWRVA